MCDSELVNRSGGVGHCLNSQHRTSYFHQTNQLLWKFHQRISSKTNASQTKANWLNLTEWKIHWCVQPTKWHFSLFRFQTRKKTKEKHQNAQHSCFFYLSQQDFPISTLGGICCFAIEIETKLNINAGINVCCVLQFICLAGTRMHIPPGRIEHYLEKMPLETGKFSGSWSDDCMEIESNGISQVCSSFSFNYR